MRKPRALIACESSGRVRDAFVRHGVDAVSCDLLPTDSPGSHVQGDVLELLARDPEWDLLIGHPTCKYLTNSGVRWLYLPDGSLDTDRWTKMEEGVRFFRALLEHPGAVRVAVENPVMHGHAQRLVGRGPDCTFQPWEHGHGEIKRSCLWLRNLPPLVPSKIVSGREAKVHRMAPGPDRWKKRSETLPGVAEAIAAQYAPLLFL